MGLRLGIPPTQGGTGLKDEGVRDSGRALCHHRHGTGLRSACVSLYQFTRYHSCPGLLRDSLRAPYSATYSRHGKNYTY